jgi:endoplasmic reticulum-Golgi intermediate compartment protein 3
LLLYFSLLILVLNLERSELNNLKIGDLFENSDLILNRLDSRQKVIGKFISNLRDAKGNEESGNSENCGQIVLSYLKKNEKLPENLHDIVQCKNENWPKSLGDSINEGCKVSGHLKVNKISGEFHFIPKIKLDDRTLCDSSPNNCDINFSHKVNELYFGEKIKEIDQMRDISIDLGTNDNINYSYFLKLVLIELSNIRGDKENGYQISITRHQRKISKENDLPSVNFNYDFSAMTICKTQKRKPFTSFITGLCAIVGGIYTIAALIDSLFFRAQRSLFTKTQTGKYF